MFHEPKFEQIIKPNPNMKKNYNQTENAFKANILLKKSILLFILSLFTFFTNAHSKKEDIVGNYMVPSKDGAIQIYEKDGKYFGKIILNKDSTKCDVNNPDKEKRTRKTLGLNILNNFTFDKGTWENGTIYDPKNGKTYSCKITQNTNGDLNVRGFIGISMLGRTETFTKLKSK